jgi:hypothetical protein
MNTCAGADTSVDPRVLEEIRKYIQRTQPGRSHLDAENCCLVEDLGGRACTGTSCMLAKASGTKHETGHPAPRMPIGAALAPSPRPRKGPKRRRSGRQAAPLVLAAKRRTRGGRRAPRGRR